MGGGFLFSTKRVELCRTILVVKLYTYLLKFVKIKKRYNILIFIRKRAKEVSNIRFSFKYEIGCGDPICILTLLIEVLSIRCGCLF